MKDDVAAVAYLFLRLSFFSFFSKFIAKVIKENAEKEKMLELSVEKKVFWRRLKMSFEAKILMNFDNEIVNQRKKKISFHLLWSWTSIKRI